MRKHLVIQLARFGDVVQTKRLVRTLEQRGEVHMCVDRTLAALARIVYPEIVVHGIAAHGVLDGAALERNRVVFDALAEEAFTAVYNLNHAGFNRALARLFPPEIVHGHSMRDGQPLRSPWVRMAFRWTLERCIAPLNLVDFWAWLTDAPLEAASVNPPARGQGRGLGVVLAGRESRRSLPPPVLAGVVRTAFEAMGGPDVFLFGSLAERPAARNLLRHLPHPMIAKVVDLSGRTDWKGLADALIGLDGLLSPDTGTMHLAAHLGVPVRAFFLSSAWCHETGPYGMGHTVWQAAPACAPCLESAPCPRQTACLASFSDPAFLRSVANRCAPSGSAVMGGRAACRTVAMPSDMICFSSATDAVGGFWRPEAGEDPYGPRRAALRALVGEYLGAPLLGSDMDDAAALTELLYREADWIIPSYPTRRFAYDG